MTDREDFEVWAKAFYQEQQMSLNSSEHFSRPNEYMLNHYQAAFEGWQARGKKDAERIAELKDEIIGWRGKSIEREQHLKIANSAVEALSLQVQVLREALEVAKYSDNTTAVVDAAHNALNTTPSTDDWIRKDTLECEGTDRSGTVKLYRIKETE